MINDPPLGRPRKARRIVYERLEKFSACEMGLPVSRGDHSEIPPQGVLWKAAGSDWRNPTGIVSAEGGGIGRRQRDARSCPHAAEDPTQVLRCQGLSTYLDAIL